MRHRLSLVTWLAFLLLGGATGADAKTVPIAAGPVPVVGTVTSGLIRLAQAAPAPAAAPAEAQPADDEPIGNVATLSGTATVTRHNAPTPLKLQDDIFLNDVLQTSANSTLGVTFNDATTFNLTANARIAVDNYVYQEGGTHNSALFDIAKGTVAFVAAEVAHSGDMKISTPTATLGIRGTTGLVEVPEGAATNYPNNVAVKLYPDADGRVGRIEVNDRAGARLGFLTQGASGFTIRPGTGGARFAAVPLVIPRAAMLRDQGFVRQLHAAQNLGRQVVFQQREFRRANPNFVNPNRPIRQLQPGQTRPNGLPGQRRQNGLPGQPGQPPLPNVPNRGGQQQPDQLNRPGQQAPGQLNRAGQRQ
ncbi:MAG: FecR domain-containing protein, partial [Bradyrhizobium sp.]|uniref:FecR family protein n=1 Tax=Bradyrhizobium sp. TaxID=376 RepID=UPI0023A78699